MKILLAYSSKTKNTKKVAEAIYDEIKNLADVKLIDIKKQRKPLGEEFDLYILGAWTDKTNANKNMQKFIDDQNIHNKDVAIFLTCGVPREHYHAEDSINNYIQFMDEYKSYISENINNYLYKEQDIFSKSFEGILDAAKIGDINWFIDSANDISLQFGKQPVIKDTMDFLQKMESDETIII